MNDALKQMVANKTLSFQEALKMSEFETSLTPFGVWRAQTNNFGAADSSITNDTFDPVPWEERIKQLEQKLMERRRR